MWRSISAAGRCRVDAVFGVKDELVSKVVRHDEPVMPDGKPASGPWYTMTYEFHVRPGEGHVPQPLMAAE